MTLGNGAFAEWFEDGRWPVEADGASAAATIFIHGATNADFMAHVEVLAAFSGITRTVLDERVLIEKGADFVVPIDLTAALRLHERQVDYVTRLRASVSVADGDTAGAAQVLDKRYLVLSAKGKSADVVDAKVAAANYPYGVTSAAEWERVQPTLLHQAPDGRLTAIDPGITDETIDERDREDRATNRNR
jgi:hypothetical protein